MNADYDYDRDDPTFLDDLRASRESVERVAHWLVAQGHPVVIRPTFERPDASQMGAYRDHGDLEIMQRIEVKQRKSLTFSCREDFPYESIIVDRCHCYDHALPKPYAYIILNRDLTVAFVIETKATRAEWSRVTKHDRAKKRDREFYECPIALVRVVRVA